MRSPRIRLFAVSNTAIILAWAVLATACGSEDAQEGAATDSTAAVADTAPSQPLPGSVLESADYVGLEDGNISFHLHWVNGPVAKDALTGTEAPDLERVRVAAGRNFDRVIFIFAGAALPGYELAWTKTPSEGCSTSSVAPAGAKHLRVRFRPASSPGRPTAAVEAGHHSLQAVAQTCAQNDHVVWHLALTDSAQIRVLEMGAPPRLVVDVREPSPPVPVPTTTP